MATGLQPREERTVVTVVFTALVGFTKPPEELNPEAVRALASRTCWSYAEMLRARDRAGDAERAAELEAAARAEADALGLALVPPERR